MDPLNTEEHLPLGALRGEHMDTEKNLPKNITMAELSEEGSKQPATRAPVEFVMRPEKNAVASNPGELAGEAREKEMPSS